MNCRRKIRHHVSTKLDDALVKKIQTALVDMDKTEAGRRIIANSKKKLTGHVAAEDSLFDVVRRTAKTAGISALAARGKWTRGSNRLAQRKKLSCVNTED